MSFLDDKEDIIKVELTQYGKKLLKDGKFKPAYYSFEDEGVIYDSLYVGQTEIQDNIQDRILDASVSVDPQYVHYGLESNFLLGLNESTQDEAERTHSHLNNSLGESAMQTQNAPAWSVVALRGEISGSNAYMTGSGVRRDINIPQVTFNSPNITVNVVSDASGIVLENRFGTDGSDPQLNFDIFSDDDTFVEVRDDFLLIEINEANSLFKEENFDIEVFEVEWDSVNQRELLTPLSFLPQEEFDQELWVEPIEQDIEEIDSTYAEHYLLIETDFEIEEQILCKYTKADQRKGIYGKRLTECDKDEFEEVNIYETDNTDRGEPC